MQLFVQLLSDAGSYSDTCGHVDDETPQMIKTHKKAVKRSTGVSKRRATNLYPESQLFMSLK